MKLIYLYIVFLLITACNARVEKVNNDVLQPIACRIVSDSLPKIGMDQAFLSFFLFEEERLKMFTQGIPADDKGKFGVEIVGNQKDRICVVWSKYAAVTNASSLSHLHSCITKNHNGDIVPFYTGASDIQDSKSFLQVQLQCGVSCVDIEICKRADMILDSCLIEGVSDCSYVMPGANKSPENVTHKAKMLVLNTTETIHEAIYLYESFGVPLKAKLYIRCNGKHEVIEITIANEVKRNKRYKIQIGGQKSVFSNINLKIEDWNIAPNSIIYNKDN